MRRSDAPLAPWQARSPSDVARSAFPSRRSYFSHSHRQDGEDARCAAPLLDELRRSDAPAMPWEARSVSDVARPALLSRRSCFPRSPGHDGEAAHCDVPLLDELTRSDAPATPWKARSVSDVARSSLPSARSCAYPSHRHDGEEAHCAAPLLDEPDSRPASLVTSRPSRRAGKRRGGRRELLGSGFHA